MLFRWLEELDRSELALLRMHLGFVNIFEFPRLPGRLVLELRDKLARDETCRALRKSKLRQREDPKSRVLASLTAHEASNKWYVF